MTQEVIKEAFQEEVKDEILSVNESGGKTYRNLNLNSFTTKGGIKVRGLKPGEYITVQKQDDYFEVTKSQPIEGQYGQWFKYQGAVIVDGEPYWFQWPSFVFEAEQTAEEFNNSGGLSDKIQISKQKVLTKNKKGQEVAEERIVFRKVE